MISLNHKLIPKENKGRTCKHCNGTFGDEIEMFQSQRYFHWICQACFHKCQEDKIIP